MKWRRHLRDFSGAAGASFAATVADGLVYLALLWTLVESGTIRVGVAAALGAVLGGTVHYSLNRFVVFRRFHAPITRSAATYFPMSWLAAVFHGLFTEVFSGMVEPELAWFGSKGVIWVLWTYPMSRYVVFGGVGASDSGDETGPHDPRPGPDNRRR